MGHVTAVVTNTAFRGRHDDGSETTATWKAAKDTDFGTTPDVNFRLRFVVAETAGGTAKNVDAHFQYRHIEGTNTWTDVTTTSSVVRAFLSPNFAEGDTTTQQVGTGTFVGTNAGMTEDGEAITSGDLVSSELEVEACLQIRSVDTATGDTIEMRTSIDGAAPGGTPVLPIITVGEARAVTQSGTGLDAMTMTSNDATVTIVIKRNVPATTAVLEQKFGGFGTTTVNTYHVDGHTFTSPTWTNASNANDGSTSTYADESSNGVGRWTGTTIPNTGSNDIVQIRGRWFLSTDDPTYDRAELQWLGGSPSVAGYGTHYPVGTTGFPSQYKVGTTTPAWTDWAYVNPAPEESGAGTLGPYEWAYAYDYLGTIIQGSIPSTDNRLYTVEYEVTSGLTYEGYLDGTTTDADGVWSNDANLVDGSTSTGASTSTAMTTSSDFSDNIITADGTTVSASIAGDIYTVVFRVLYTATASGGGRCRVLDGTTNLCDGGGSSDSYTLQATRTDWWGPWSALNKESLTGGEWTQAVLDGLTFEAGMNTGQTGTLTIKKVEFQALAQDFNPQGATVDITTGRVASGSTAALICDATDITLNIDRSIDEISNSEQLEFNPTATVVRDPDIRAVVGTTQKAKKWRPLGWSEWLLDGHTGIYSVHDAGTINNMLDGDLGTSYDVTSEVVPWIQGLAGTLTPQHSPTAVPVGLKIRAYVSGTASSTMSLWAGWDYGNQRSEATTSSRYTLDSVGSAVVTGGGGGNWSEWIDLPMGYNNWDDGGATDLTTPLTWNAIQEKFVFYSWTDTGTIKCHAVQIMVEEAEPANLISGYVDASHGWYDDFGAWRDTQNVWDGSTTTYASRPKGTATTWLNGKLVAAGNTLTQGGAGEVRAVWMRARLRGQYSAAQGDLTCILYPYHPNYGDTGSGTKLPVYNPDSFTEYMNQGFASPHDTTNTYFWEMPATSNTGFWSPWYQIDFDSFDSALLAASTTNPKSWEEVQKLGFELYRGNEVDGAVLEIAKVEYVVLAEPPNEDRGGGKVKKDRGVIQSTTGLDELIMTGTQADISFAAANRTVTGITQALAWDGTTYLADIARDRVSTGATQALAWDGTNHDATVNRSWNKASTTEDITFSDNDSTVVRDRVATGLTQALAWDGTTYPATIDFATHVTVTGTTALMQLDGTNYPATATRDRVSTGATTDLAWDGTTYKANITTNVPRDVTGLTQALAWDGTNYSAIVAANRGVISAIESLILAGNGSIANLSRGVLQPLSEALAWDGTTYPATIDFQTNLVVTGITQDLILTPSVNTNVNERRVVSSQVELTALVENASTVNATLQIEAGIEVLSFADNDSTVSRNRVFTTATEVISLAGTDSTVDRQRGVNAGTEALAWDGTTYPAGITRGANLDIIATTSASTLAGNLSIVNATLDLLTTTEVVTFVENAAVAGLSRNALGITEVLSQVSNDATVDTSSGAVPRDVTCSTEVLSFGENAGTATRDRLTLGISEQLQVVFDTAGLNVERGVTTSTAVNHFSGVAATINASRVTSGVTEVLIGVGTNAIVSTTTDRIVNCLSELLVLDAIAASTYMSRTVQSVTGQLDMASDSSVARVRNVTGLTEIVTMSGASALNLSRILDAPSQALTFTELAASVFRGANLDVTANSAVMLLAGEPATIVFPRTVTGLTEALVLSGTAAVLNRPKFITCSTEVLVLTEGLAKIGKSRTGAMPGSAIYVYPDAARPVWVHPT